MKTVVIGGTGLIGSKLVDLFAERGHEAVPAAPATGVNTLTGEGLPSALEGASVLVDVSNSPSFETSAVREFFETSTRNLIEAANAAGVGHYVALSVVGADRLPDSGYFQAKMAQEQLIAESGLPYSLVHATQFYEFIDRIADSSSEDGTVRIAPVRFQPMAADDVALAVCRVALGDPIKGMVEVAGPKEYRFDELVREALASKGDPRTVVADPNAPYFGAILSDRSLVPDPGALLGSRNFDAWAAQAGATA